MLPSAPSESQYLLKKKNHHLSRENRPKWMEERKRGKGGGREREKADALGGRCDKWTQGMGVQQAVQTKTALLMYVEQGKPRREKACRRGREVAKLARNINVEREKDYSKPRSKWIEKCMWIDIETNYKLIRRPETTKISWRKRLKWSEAAGWWSAGDLLSKSLQGKSTVFNKQNYRIPYMQSHFYCNTIADYI